MGARPKDEFEADASYLILRQSSFVKFETPHAL